MPVAQQSAAPESAKGTSPPPSDTDAQFFAAYYEVLVSRVETSRRAAETVQRSAAAIAGFYAAVLGVAFSVTEAPLPLTALIPGILLAASVVCAMVYLAWQGGRASQLSETVHPELEADSFERRRAFLIDFQVIIARFVRARVGWLKLSIVCMAIGVAALPLPFIDW